MENRAEELVYDRMSDVGGDLIGLKLDEVRLGEVRCVLLRLERRLIGNGEEE
jgi:hypothetical protein